MDHRLIQSYVRDKYLVSTVLRESSALDGPSEYYETMAWYWDAQTKEVGKLIEQRAGGLAAHFSICQQLADKEPKPTIEKINWGEY